MVQQTLKDIFSGYVHPETGIFKDRNRLSHDYVPEEMKHRDDEINHMASIIAPSIQNSRVSNIFIYGKTGTGKTLVARHVTTELEKASNNRVSVIYMNCKMKRVSDTEYRLFAELTRVLGKEVPATGLPTDAVYRMFYDAVEEKGRSIILVLDEIDALVEKVGDEILYNLTRGNQDLKRSRISIIGISNNISFIDGLDSRVKSTLSEEEIIFPPYNANQLKDILYQRSSGAFNPGVLGTGVLEKCSALAAQEHGDARKALDLLRIAGELAERSKDTQVTVRHVDRAEEKLDLDRAVEVVRSQPKQSLAVLAAVLKINEKGERNIQTGDIFDLYVKMCSRCGLKPLTQRRVSDLIAELDMLGIITAKVISKGRYGRTREISIPLSKPILAKIKRVLEQNYLL